MLELLLILPTLQAVQALLLDDDEIVPGLQEMRVPSTHELPAGHGN